MKSQILSPQQRQQLEAANLAHSRGDLAGVTSICDRLLEDNPDLIPALVMGGIAFAKAGHVDPAVDRLKRAIMVDPSLALAHVWLARVLRNSKPEEARVHAESAMRLEPGKPEIQSALAVLLVDAGEYSAAREMFESSISVEPANPNHHFGRYAAMEGLGEFEEALKSLRRAVRYGPNPEWRHLLASAELHAKNFHKAREIATALIRELPDAAELHFLLARILKEEGRDEESELELRTTIELSPGHDAAHALLGGRYQTQGRFDDALTEFSTALQLNPDLPEVYYGICSSKKITEVDRELIARMEHLSSSEGRHPGEMALLEFGLGKAYQDLGRAEDAMRHFDRANSLSAQVNFKGRPFDREGFRRDVEGTLRLFSKGFMDSQMPGSQSDKPVFIVGMLRSGTTLMEHILSCHPQVGAAGEQPFWALTERDIVDYGQGRIDTPALRSSAERYLEILEGLAPGKERITDKNPANVLGLGLTHLAFPQARIIHMRRHPVDTMMSIYMTAIRNPPPFACDRENIVFAYREYQKAADHWRRVLPTERFLDVDYEALVSDPKSETSRVLEFLGLKWHEACARPERNPRVVKTPSLWQVRQNIHQDSVKKWVAYGSWLGPFADFLDE